jgi:hypothetical protein
VTVRGVGEAVDEVSDGDGGAVVEVDVRTTVGVGEVVGVGELVGAGLDDGVGDGAGAGAVAPRASRAPYAFTRPNCTPTRDPLCVSPLIGSTLEKRAVLSWFGVALGAAETMSARMPATTGAEIDVPPTGAYPYGAPLNVSHVVMSLVGAATETQPPQLE